MPPLSTVVELTEPPLNTNSPPPLLTVVKPAAPLPKMYCAAPLLIVVLRTAPPAGGSSAHSCVEVSAFPAVIGPRPDTHSSVVV